MARITKADQEATPIYFQTRRESKYTTPYVALPEKDQVIANLEEFYDKKATEELQRNLRRPNEGLYF